MSEEGENKNKVNPAGLPEGELPNRVNEPMVEYRKSEIQFFNSLEEMNESQYIHWLGLTPVQRLAEHYTLLTSVYNYKDIRSSYDKIYFDS